MLMKTNVKITQSDLEKLKRPVQIYGDNDTFQLFQKLQVQFTYIISCI